MCMSLEYVIEYWTKKGRKKTPKKTNTPSKKPQPNKHNIRDEKTNLLLHT